MNFAVRVFLEAPSQPRLPQLKTFSQRMEGLFLADEKCLLMNQQLEEFKGALREEALIWDQWQDMDGVLSCLSDYLFAHTHQHIFYPNGPTDKEVDK